MAIESSFDLPFIAAMALKEKQIQQNYRPIIAVHKWFARRPGTLFRGLLLAEFGERPLKEAFFEANDLGARLIADPFMGGGTPLIEANRVGCNIIGFDINPMAVWIVREEIEQIDLGAYREAARGLISELNISVGELYRTDCAIYGDPDVPVKYFLWVKTIDCEKCGDSIDLFPGYLIADNTRHPKYVIVCHICGNLCEALDRRNPGHCAGCGGQLREIGPAKRNRCECSTCRHVNRYPRPNDGPPRHRLFAIEYHNPHRRGTHRGRFFKAPDAKDHDRVRKAASLLGSLQSRFAPDQEILPGDETDRLHRWGYKFYAEMFNARQLLGLEKSCEIISKQRDKRIRNALATNLSDLLRYQNMLCRYDTMALKSLDIFSVHGFPVGLVQCESNLIGIVNNAGASVGSGGWGNITQKYYKAKKFCEAPFEVRTNGNRKSAVPIIGEFIGSATSESGNRSVYIQCKSATSIDLPEASLDAVFTDPPYFGNVQYGELMDFCYIWLRQLVRNEVKGFERESSRSRDELTGNITESRGLEHFTEGLSSVYRRMANALKIGAPFVFTFHHNKIEAYYAIGVAILDAGLTCSYTIPCPAEMGGSIHIHGTTSSVIDTVFVCRAHGKVRRRYLCERPHDLMELIRGEITELKIAGAQPTLGDIRCIAFGHLIRLAIWNLRKTWDDTAPTAERVKRIAEMISALGDPEAIAMSLSERDKSKPRQIYPDHYPARKAWKIRDLQEADAGEWIRI